MEADNGHPDYLANNRHEYQLSMRVAYRQGISFLVGWFLLFPLSGLTAAHAHHATQSERVELQLASGATVSARYHQGERGPAVLLLHGFLQTSDYLTVSSLLSGLMDEGYTVLAPTLSLGVDRRKASLDCKAIHTHTLDGDLVEIQAWIDWLESRGHRQIALVGHSFGSLKLLAYLADHPSPSVTQLIATSLLGIDNEFSDGEFEGMIADAQRRLLAGNKRLANYRMSYCDSYPTTPEAFLSYTEWTREKILRTLAEISIPVRTILGEEDRRMHPDWIAQLRETDFDVMFISGAGHFFDGQHEFELLDRVNEALQSPPVRQP